MIFLCILFENTKYAHVVQPPWASPEAKQKMTAVKNTPHSLTITLHVVTSYNNSKTLNVFFSILSLFTFTHVEGHRAEGQWPLIIRCGSDLKKENGWAGGGVSFFFF